MKWSAAGRVNRAMTWARALRLARVEPDGKHLRLVLTPDGQEWLSSGAAEPPVEIYRLMSTFEIHPELFSPHLDLFLLGLNPWDTVGPADVRFLGTHVAALKLESGKRPPYRCNAKPEDHLALRKHLDIDFAELKSDVFYRLDSVLSHLVFAEQNPLNLGLPMEQVALFWINRSVAPARLQREEIGRLVLNAFVLERLVPIWVCSGRDRRSRADLLCADIATTPTSAARSPGLTPRPSRIAR